VIGFDMGGTSTDVSHYAGELRARVRDQVAGVRMRAPMMSIHTVAAGGGSILRFDGARLRAGPESAGANPGPRAIGAAARSPSPMRTCCSGKIQPEWFPKVFGPARTRRSTRRRDVANSPRWRRGRRAPAASDEPEEVAEGFSTSPSSMANAIKKISVARGYDVTRYTLQCFGGAGGQHACLVADALGMSASSCHPLAGVLSAYGMGLADQGVSRDASIEQPLGEPGLARRAVTGARCANRRRARSAAGRGSGMSFARDPIAGALPGTDTALAVRTSAPGCRWPAPPFGWSSSGPTGGASRS
jgi:5-oxoprolinase (ATP-hydrolysing)